jgi:hypothetical protein
MQFNSASTAGQIRATKTFANFLACPRFGRAWAGSIQTASN